MLLNYYYSFYLFEVLLNYHLNLVVFISLKANGDILSMIS